MKSLKNIESKYRILIDENKSPTISKNTGNEDVERECTTEREKFDIEINKYIDKVNVDNKDDVDLTEEKISTKRDNSNSTHNNKETYQSFDHIINNNKSPGSVDKGEIVLKEEEYIALVNENQELIDQLNNVREQLTTIKDKHISLMESINFSLTKDSNKIELKLDDCLDFIRKSNESNIANMLWSKKSTPLNTEKLRQNTREFDSNLKQINESLKTQVDDIVHKKTHLESRMKLLESYMLQKGVKVPSDFELDKKKPLSKNDMFEAIAYNQIPRSNKSFSNKEQKGLTEPKIKGLIRKSRDKNMHNISRSYKSQNNELDNIDTRRIKSDQLIIEHITRDFSNKERDIKGLETLHDEEAYINLEKMIQQFLNILEILDSIRKLCLEDQTKTEVIENEHSERLSKIFNEIENLPFIEIDSDGKIDLTAAVVNLTRNDEYFEYDQYFENQAANFDPKNKEQIIEDIDQIEDDGDMETKEKNIPQIVEGEEELELTNELDNIEIYYQDKSNQNKLILSKSEEKDQDENGNPE